MTKKKKKRKQKKNTFESFSNVLHIFEQKKTTLKILSDF